MPGTWRATADRGTTARLRVPDVRRRISGLRAGRLRPKTRFRFREHWSGESAIECRLMARHTRKVNRLHIRLARLSDLAAIEAIERVSFSGERQASRRSLQRSLRSTSQTVWVMEDHANSNTRVVAAAVVHHRPHSLRLYSIAVLPEFRGHGAGGRLVERVVQQARETGRRALTLESDRANRALTGWYEKLGFSRVATLDNYYSPGATAVRMRRRLAPGRQEANKHAHE